MLEGRCSSQLNGRSINELIKIQEEIAKKVIIRDIISIDKIEFVCGVDQAFFDDKVISVSTLFKFPDLRFIEFEVDVREVNFPYIPTFLMFREGESAIEAVKKVLRENTVILVDGSGIAHPRRCGLATYIGVKLSNPSIGITKKRLYGEVEEPKYVGDSKPILDGEVIGYSFKSCKRCKPIYISPGHMVSVEQALTIVKKCIKNYKLPIPIKKAHEIAKKEKLKYLSDLNSTI